MAEKKLKLARRCGADEAFDIMDSSKDYERATSTLVIIGVNKAYQSALSLTANHGAIIAIGLTNIDISGFWNA